MSNNLARGSTEIIPLDLVGETLEGRYRIDRRIGRGSTGIVYRGRDLARADEPVAIKVIHDHLLSDPIARARFHREATRAGRLRHPNLVGVIDVAIVGGRLALILELADGPTLALEIERAVRMSPLRVVRILRGLCAGLDAAHAAGLVHRDLKPDNVIVTRNDVPRIIDFGTAIEHDQPRLTDHSQFLGTPAYVSPEQALGGSLDGRADLFALGVIAFEMLTGATPFEGTADQVVRANLGRAMPRIDALDPRLQAILDRLVAKRPGDRFHSAVEVTRALDQI